MRIGTVGIGLAALFWSQTVLAAPTWHVTEAAGDVQMKRGALSSAVRRGVALAAGDVVRTGPNARAVLVRGGEFVVVSPGTQVRLPDAQQTGGIIQMIEDFGSAIFTIQKKETPHFGVRTPYLAALVKGTTFAVSVTPGGGASVRVLEGAVEVQTPQGSEHQLVRAGMGATVSSAEPEKLHADGRAEARAEGEAHAPTAASEHRLDGAHGDRSAHAPSDHRPDRGGERWAGSGNDTFFADKGRSADHVSDRAVEAVAAAHRPHTPSAQPPSTPAPHVNLPSVATPAPPSSAPAPVPLPPLPVPTPSTEPGSHGHSGGSGGSPGGPPHL
jgi:hypothetical protein